LKKANLEARLAEQVGVLDAATDHVKSGGRLVYVTCSLLAPENTEQVRAFLERHEGFRIVPYGEAWRSALNAEPPASADGSNETLLLTPASHGTDGFFIAVLERSAG
jgi:16S rRNA (cytosine967-C5)-methyltransferase